MGKRTRAEAIKCHTNRNVFLTTTLDSVLDSVTSGCALSSYVQAHVILKVVAFRHGWLLRRVYIRHKEALYFIGKRI